MPSEPVHLEADLTRLAQVLLNLLNNAAKYTDQGGHIWLTAQREGDRLGLRSRMFGVRDVEKVYVSAERRTCAARPPVRAP